MAIRADYSVVKLPDTYVTTKTVYRYEKDATDPSGKGRIRYEEIVEEKGGWLFTFLRGHQIRLTDEKQIALFGLATTQRLIDDSTGLEVNQQGVPIDIAAHVHQSILADGGAPDTVEGLVAQKRDTGDPIADAIADTE